MLWLVGRKRELRVRTFLAKVEGSAGAEAGGGAATTPPLASRGRLSAPVMALLGGGADAGMDRCARGALWSASGLRQGLGRGWAGLRGEA